ALELVCEILDENLARKYEKEGYVVKSTKVSASNPIRFSIRVLQASVEKNELGMLGKQNTLKVSIANPTSDTLTYQVVIDVENEETVEEMPYESQAFHSPEAISRIISVPVAEPDSWLLTIPPGGASYSLGFTAWVRRTEEREYGSYSTNVAYWPSGQVTCNLMVKVLRNGKLVAKQRLLETFENFDVGRTIARHPFETIGGFLVGFGTAALLTALSFAVTPIPVTLAGLSFAVSPVTLVGLAVSTASALIVYTQTGSGVEALTYSPLGVIIAPIRALTDPTMDDSARASIIGAMIGAPLGAFAGKQIALDVAMKRMPGELRSDSEICGKLYGIEGKHGTPIACTIARNIEKLYSYLDVPDAKELVNMILSDALASRQDALYIASTLEWASRMPSEFLSKHASDIMEWLGSPILRGKLYSLLQLSPKEAFQLSQSAGGDFQAMLRMAEFKHVFNQLSKLGPDTVRILSFSSNGIEVGVEKGLAGKLYPGIQKGSVVEFSFARGSVVLKGLLTYAEERALGEPKYLVFSFKAEERIPAIFELFKEDLQVIPGQQVQKDFGFNAFTLSNGKLSMDKGSLSMSGEVRFSDGMTLRMDNPGVMLVPTENPLEMGSINRMLLTGGIGGTSVIVSEDGAVQAFHGGSYLPAVVTADALGLQLGLLAKPSGGTLTITGESLLARGIQEPGLLSITYPSGESWTVIYTGGSLQAPLLTYPSGAFVGVQEVETKVVWTSFKRDELYTQIASVSEILSGILGGGFAEELVKTLLLNGLTDSQTLDIANELVRSVEWLKMLSANKRIDAVRRITDYVKKGDSAEEARKKVEKESEEFVKNVELEISSFCNSISDTTLANEVDDLLRHVLKTLGPDAARWLLDLLKRIRSEAGNAGLKIAVEKAFKYPESKEQGCALASEIVSRLREKSIRQAWEELNGIVNYPEGLKIEGCKLREHGDNLRIKVGKERLEPYLGNEPCWVKVKVKRRTLYKKYDGEKLDFDLPKDMEVTEDEIKNGIEVTIIKITTYEFISDVLEESGRLFRIAFKSGKYMLIVDGKEVCELFMKEDLHYDGTGDYGPAVIFAIKDSEEKEHLIKLAYRKSEEYLVRIKIGTSFRRVESAKYDEDMRMLRIEYHKEGRIFRHEVFLESPKAVLIRMVKKVRDLL
ncbi:MAG: hypothetical protein FGF50_11565, partial [Candidatus Brockarchaeota archaeon]|nr:hypothetical protein [Candidatus Brockarchaeota archaeon]